jgi:hypothetical protein
MITIMSEMPAGDTHDVIHRAGAVVAVVVPIAEYQRLRQAAEEQRIRLGSHRREPALPVSASTRNPRGRDQAL